MYIDFIVKQNIFAKKFTTKVVYIVTICKCVIKLWYF